MHFLTVLKKIDSFGLSKCKMKNENEKEWDKFEKCVPVKKTVNLPIHLFLQLFFNEFFNQIFALVLKYSTQVQ